MEHKLLQNIGLTKNQSLIYNTLLENGPLEAHSINRRVRINRSLVYVVLNELIKINLIERDDSKSIAIFKPNSPKVLEKIVTDKKNNSELAQTSFDSIFHQMQQQFEIITGQPGIRFYPGIEGQRSFYEKLNKDMPNEILLIRSDLAEENKGMIEVAKKQVEKQVKLGIKVKVISPSLSLLSKIIPLDEKRLTERRILSKDTFKTPTQIIIYNNVVAITTYKEPVVTTVITHEDIVQTFTTMFMYIWKTSLVETQSLSKQLQKKGN